MNGSNPQSSTTRHPYQRRVKEMDAIRARVFQETGRDVSSLVNLVVTDLRRPLVHREDQAVRQRNWIPADESNKD